MKIVVDNKIKYLTNAFDGLADVVECEGKEICAETVADADALFVRTRTKCNANLLKDSKVKAIFTATIGFDHIDTAFCESHNIWWQNAPGCNAASVQQYVFSALAELHIRSGLPLRNSTLAIVGVGHVGKLVEKWARLLGMRVLLVDPLRAEAEGKAAFVSYHYALQNADILTFHVPLVRSGQNATFHLFGHHELSLLRHCAAIINTSRGDVVDTEALIRGLQTKQISHAVVDVWENEPCINQQLMRLADIATPHIAGYSADSKLNATQMSVEAFYKFFGVQKQWQPVRLHEPNCSEVSINKAFDTEDAACQMFLSTYNILADDQRLRSQPQAFEQLRGSYPLRREIAAFGLSSDSPHSSFLRKFGIR